MARKSVGSGSCLTRRDVLAHAALGAAAAAVSPLVGRAQALDFRTTSALAGGHDFRWKFLKRTLMAGAQAVIFADAVWRDVDLPHDWSIEGPVGENEPSGGNGGYLPTGMGWYRKKFHVSAEDRGRVVMLEFDGVYMNSGVNQRAVPRAR